MRFNDTTRSYFEKLAKLSSPRRRRDTKEFSTRAKSPAIREYLAKNEPGAYSMLHTSISPNIIQAGYQVNVIPSKREATLDIRALPDENIEAFYDMMRKVIGDPAIEMVPEMRNQRPGAAPSRIDQRPIMRWKRLTEVYGVNDAADDETGATDMAFLRAKGVQCYGVGAMVDEEDAAKGFGAHSDQERILEGVDLQTRAVLLGRGDVNRREALRHPAHRGKTLSVRHHAMSSVRKQHRAFARLAAGHRNRRAVNFQMRRPAVETGDGPAVAAVFENNPAARFGCRRPERGIEIDQ